MAKEYPVVDVAIVGLYGNKSEKNPIQIRIVQMIKKGKILRHEKSKDDFRQYKIENVEKVYDTGYLALDPCNDSVCMNLVCYPADIPKAVDMIANALLDKIAIQRVFLNRALDTFTYVSEQTKTYHEGDENY